MLCEMPVDLRCKIDSSLPLALVLTNSESCRAFREAMRDDSLWELLLRRDFPHYMPPAASSGSWCAQYKQQHAKHTRTDADIKQAVEACCDDPVSGEQKYGHIRDWIVDQVTNMTKLFQGKRDFNENISRWNVGQVKSMDYMFVNASSFNQDVGQWNVGQVETMRGMFQGASSFNQNIGQWNVGQVNTMHYMFVNASSFNQDIGQWNVGQVETMLSMFKNASSFNQDIGQWDVGQVKNMRGMFDGASSLEQRPHWFK